MAVSKFANHSCYANTIGGMQGDRMIIIAAHPIEEGEQVVKKCHKSLCSCFSEFSTIVGKFMVCRTKIFNSNNVNFRYW